MFCGLVVESPAPQSPRNEQQHHKQKSATLSKAGGEEVTNRDSFSCGIFHTSTEVELQRRLYKETFAKGLTPGGEARR